MRRKSRTSPRTSPFAARRKPSRGFQPMLGQLEDRTLLASGNVSFSDAFNGGVSPLWGNQIGAWSAAGSVYSATTPGNFPNAHSTLPFDLTNFTVNVNVNNLQDGGIWLRSTEAPARQWGSRAFFSVTGGNRGAGTGLYWHVVTDGSTYGSGLDGVNGLFTSGASDAQIQVVVSGDSYSAYINGSSTPATTLTTSAFTSGGVGLYDNSHQTFANFSVQGQSARARSSSTIPGTWGSTPRWAPPRPLTGKSPCASAIQQVDIDGGGSIGFASGMTIVTSGLPAITAPGVTINGGTLGSVVVKGEENGPSGLVLDGGAPLSRAWKSRTLAATVWTSIRPTMTFRMISSPPMAPSVSISRARRHREYR